MKKKVSKNRLSSRPGPRRKGAFTLIELLVVVSIIALLISILLPSLRKAREQAKVTLCIANLKGIGSASLTYATDDATEAAVPVQWTQFAVDKKFTTRVGASAWGGKSGRGSGTTQTDRMWWGTKNDRGPAHRPMNSFIYKDGFVDYKNNPGPQRRNWKSDEELDLGVFRCPSDTGWTSGLAVSEWVESGLTSYDHFGNSYVANNLWIGPGAYGDEYMDSNSAFLRPVSRIPNPANTVYYEENCGRYSHWYGPQAGGCPLEEGVVGGWHGRDWVFSVSFADAHAAQIRMKGTTSPRLSEYPDGTQYTYWRCVICRGEGWQKDTLPSPPVPTLVEAPS